MDNIIFQTKFKNRTKYYRIDIKEFWFDKKLCWVAYAIDGELNAPNITMAEKVKCFTRAEENNLPKAVGRYASGLVDYCNDVAKWVERNEMQLSLFS